MVRSHGPEPIGKTLYPKKSLIEGQERSGRRPHAKPRWREGWLKDQ